MTGEVANVGIDNTASFIDRSSNSQGEHGSHGLPHEAGGAFFGRRTMSSVLYSSKFGTISVRPSPAVIVMSRSAALGMVYDVVRVLQVPGRATFCDLGIVIQVYREVS